MDSSEKFIEHLLDHDDAQEYEKQKSPPSTQSPPFQMNNIADGISNY